MNHISSIARAGCVAIVTAIATSAMACSTTPRDPSATPSTITPQAVHTVLAFDPTPAQMGHAQSLRNDLRSASHDSQTRYASGALDRRAFRAELMQHWNDYVAGLQKTLGCSHDQALAVLAESRHATGLRPEGK